ncbi:MAG: type II toxin-antitoxin system RelE family toxin [Pseudonocardiaceae bacterium]
MTEADEPDASDKRWGLEVRGRAQRQLARLPEKVATAAAEFITGPLLDNPLRVGHPLRDEYDGQYSARRGRDWRVRYRLDHHARIVIILDVSHRSDTYGTR